MENPDILIVDDDVDLAAAMTNILESKHYSVAAAENRSAGMEKARALKPKLII